MTLEEAIKHAEEKAKELRTEAEQLRDIGEVISNPKQPYNEPVKNCRNCAEEHEQLAKWLKELKRVKNDRVLDEFCRLRSDLSSGDVVGCTLRTSAQMKRYIKAIDEIIEIARTKQ